METSGSQEEKEGVARGEVLGSCVCVWGGGGVYAVCLDEEVV